MTETSPTRRVRMTGSQRREQLLDVGRGLFAARGYEATSIEEIAAHAGVSKPVVYEHFGGKEGLYAVVVDREMSDLLHRLNVALSDGHPRVLVERAALALLTYIEEETDGFRILTRDSPVASSSGNLTSLLNDIASRAEHIMGREFAARGIDTALAPMYAQMLVGMVALTGQWWLEARSPDRDTVVANLVNLGWNGLAHLEPVATLVHVHPGADGGGHSDGGPGDEGPGDEGPGDEGPGDEGPDTGGPGKGGQVGGGRKTEGGPETDGPGVGDSETDGPGKAIPRRG